MEGYKPEIPEHIDDLIYLFVIDELTEAQASILDKWMDTAGNTMKFVKRANCLKDSMLQIAPSSQGLWKRLAKDLAVKVAGQKTQQRVKNNNVILDSFQDLNPKLSGSPTGHH